MTRKQTMIHQDGTMCVVSACFTPSWEFVTDISQVIFSSTDLWDQSKWTDAVHLDFNGYDISPHWDDDGNSYIVGSHAWKVA